MSTIDTNNVMKLALEALEDLIPLCDPGFSVCYDVNKAITALREALAEPTAQHEPVATITITQRGPIRIVDNNFDDCVRNWPDGEYKLYTSPPAQQRCPLCNYQHGHAIGCKNNPVDIALNKMAENARELGLDYEPAPATELREQEPVALVIDGVLVKSELPEKYTGHLYTSPPSLSLAQRTWRGLTDEEIEQGCKESWVTEQAWQSAVWWTEAKLKEKNT